VARRGAVPLDCCVAIASSLVEMRPNGRETVVVAERAFEVPK
jgi:hypothetical protein